MRKSLLCVQHGMLLPVAYKLLPLFVAQSAERVGDAERARCPEAYRE
jgi:hypothetical protein